MRSGRVLVLINFLGGVGFVVLLYNGLGYQGENFVLTGSNGAFDENQCIHWLASMLCTPLQRNWCDLILWEESYGKKCCGCSRSAVGTSGSEDTYVK